MLAAHLLEAKDVHILFLTDCTAYSDWWEMLDACALHVHIQLEVCKHAKPDMEGC